MATCAFCEREAVLPAYVSPPMCDEHQAAVLIAGHLLALGLPVTAENARQVATQYPKAGLTVERAVQVCLHVALAMVVGEG